METLLKAVEPFSAALAGRRIFHVTPLHYLPSILAHRKLMSADMGGQFGIMPRRTASRRDKMLGVSSYVHFSFDLFTPILLDKLSRGMPHCALQFSADAVDSFYTWQAAILPFNTKAWRSRGDAAPVTNRERMTDTLRAHDRLGRYPSIEFLVKGCVELDCMQSIVTFCNRDLKLTDQVINKFVPDAKFDTYMRQVSCYHGDIPAVQTLNYLDSCIEFGQVLQIPKINFD